jgi:hypothetical protein
VGDAITDTNARLAPVAAIHSVGSRPIERRSSSEFERLSGMQSDEVVGVVLAFDDLPDSGEAHRFAGG